VAVDDRRGSLPEIFSRSSLLVATMCGRFSLHNNHDIQQLSGYDVHIDEWIDQDQFIPRYNIAPRSQAPVIRRNGSNLVMQTMKWGLVPHWSKFEDKSLNTTNARSENLVEGGSMWASIKGTKRCAIPCQGYVYIYSLETSKFNCLQLF
jgi:putative SOS response-associated peptidase YedK